MGEGISAVILTIIVCALIYMIFSLGVPIGRENATIQIRQKICKQLYQQDTNKYINCNTKDINENIKLIKDITND